MSAVTVTSPITAVLVLERFLGQTINCQKISMIGKDKILVFFVSFLLLSSSTGV